jgi:hypothetical protein
MACSAGCPTQNHESWGQCVRSKRLHIQDMWAHAFNQGQNKAVDGYVAAREQGIQPASTSPKDVAIATRLSDTYGEAHQDGQFPSALKDE